MKVLKIFLILSILLVAIYAAGEAFGRVLTNGGLRIGDGDDPIGNEPTNKMTIEFGSQQKGQIVLDPSTYALTLTSFGNNNLASSASGAAGAIVQVNDTGKAYLKGKTLTGNVQSKVYADNAGNALLESSAEASVQATSTGDVVIKLGS